jgi:hypothetical protein
MARIAGVEIPDNKRLFVGLTYIYGVGRTLAIKACEAVGIDPMKKLSELSDEELARLRETCVEKLPKTLSDLSTSVATGGGATWLVCPSAGKELAPTQEPAKVRERPSELRKASALRRKVKLGQPKKEASKRCLNCMT